MTPERLKETVESLQNLVDTLLNFTNAASDVKAMTKYKFDVNANLKVALRQVLCNHQNQIN